MKSSYIVAAFASIALLPASASFAQSPPTRASSAETKQVRITYENMTTGQGFSPPAFMTHDASAPPLFKMGEKASFGLTRLAEDGNTGPLLAEAGTMKCKAIGMSATGLPTPPGKTSKAIVLELTRDHPIVSGAWMLGMTNDGFTGISGINAFELKEPMSMDLTAMEAGTEKNNEKKAYLIAQMGTDRDPEGGVVQKHGGIRADADAPAEWKFDPSKPVDAVVIGSGAGDAPLAARLARAGLSVVVLEAGRHWAPARDFATDEKEQAKLFWTDERLSAGTDPVAFGANNSGIGVGGSTLHYTAYVPRPQPDDFWLRTEFGVGQDWSISYGDLEPYFDELEGLLGVSGPLAYPWGPARKPPPLPPLGLNGAAQLMQRGCEALGFRTSPAANAALSRAYFQEGIGWRAACSNRGFCQAGCSTGAKGSMDVTFLPLALQAGAEIRPECFALYLDTDKAGRICGIVYERDGVEERQRCRNLFLCAGAIETPRLLLINGRGNGSGQVGRNFMSHTGLQLWGRFPEDVRPYKGIPGGLISEDTHRPVEADFAGGYLVQSIGVMPVTYASQVARGRGLWREAPRPHMRGYNHTAGINILGECLPDAGNYLELSEETDGRGLPKPRVHFSNGENERRLTAHGDKLMRAIWDEAGAADVWAFPRNAHVIGTCRMGTDEDIAVVDADGRSFEIPNLYVCDNSVFPSALSVNPALTIMALSLRTADRFLAAPRA